MPRRRERSNAVRNIGLGFKALRDGGGGGGGGGGGTVKFSLPSERVCSSNLSFGLEGQEGFY